MFIRSAYQYMVPILFFSVGVLLTSPVSGKTPANISKNNYNNTICRNVTRNTEQEMKLPSGILSAISLVESGKKVAGRPARTAWPWTVTAEGRGRYLPTKAAAIAEVKKLRSRGIKNIDVGCMQVNLRYHGKAFSSISDALSPVTNARYAGKFLTELHQETKSWSRAVSFYHSRTKHLADAYRKRVMTAWSEVRQLANAENSANNRNSQPTFNSTWRTARRATRLPSRFRAPSSQRWRKYRRR